MKHASLFLPLIIPIALLGGCLSAGTQASLNLDTGKGLAGAQAAATLAEKGVHSAYTSGLISKTQVIWADQIADKVDGYSIDARKAYAAGQTAAAAGFVAEITAIAATLATLQHPVTVLPAIPASAP